MRRKLISPKVLEPIVSEASALFTTKDISEDDRVRGASPELANHRNYHAFVGGALSDHHEKLGITKARTKGGAGCSGEKTGAPRDRIASSEDSTPGDNEDSSPRRDPR